MAESSLTQLDPHVSELGWTHNAKVLSCAFLSLRYGFIILSIFNDINALKRLHCHSPEAELDVQPFEVEKVKQRHELSLFFTWNFKISCGFVSG